MLLRDSGELLVADLHLGKADTFAVHGAPFGPPLLAALAGDTLSRLRSVAERVRASRLVVLGDLLHAPAGLTAELLDHVAAWRRAFPIEISLVRGNHDAKIERVLGPWRLDDLGDTHRLGPLRLTHAPCDGEGFCISGHLHPAVVLRGARDRLRLPCFASTSRGMVLPAFGAFVGGLAVDPRAYERLLAIVGDEVVDVTAHA